MGKSLDEAADHIEALYHSNSSIAQTAIPTFMQAQNEFNQKLVEQLERI